MTSQLRRRSSDYYESWHVDNYTRVNMEIGSIILIRQPSVSENESSYIATMHFLDISSKFGMQIDFYVFRRMQSLNLNPEIDFNSMVTVLKIDMSSSLCRALIDLDVLHVDARYHADDDK